MSAQYEEGESKQAEADLYFDVSVKERPYSGIPIDWSVEAVYPNPFNPELSIIVALPQTSELELRVFNILGKEVAILANGNSQAGYQKFILNANNLSSGIYFIYAAVPGKLNEVKKVVLMR